MPIIVNMVVNLYLHKKKKNKFFSHALKSSEFGFPVGAFELGCIMKGYSDKQGLMIAQFKNDIPGNDWVRSFLKKHKDLTVRLSSNIKHKRAEVGPIMIVEYFINITKELKNMSPENIWNYDKTNLDDDPYKKMIITKRRL